ncbi:bifunctional salicylyl-CoA 5-hydroxylase/oxidoreductase [Acetobacter sp. TBRC 12305]|uniref:Bifunctional salicylyl-CoA 5-hydroxylase/oxidoreductase n=1 Tax=Acetobacter garciniae TaxID=2817435 RepID=A0A939HLQ2_9PROT|nr:bifunctional salicylyl-CoA 5-hydroxylase/oxidoreductase [Acetobacter garciniae]MBO1325080.1 bifunctional salicylyl-CoA 5-hydroxylase/oxidoreductase [Acetobacter garciniae]MBX0344949.1 bifunctional salicylyl-CoA 5-hydroxylase/oxidoreductase [Acetobacter garciniae]
MHIVCVGGGPAGLYFALLVKKRHPVHRVSVIERNRPYDTFGWGVVFSDATMVSMLECDPESAAEIQGAFNHWDDIEVRINGRSQVTTGHGFVGIGRRHLLNILQDRCRALGVNLIFERDVRSEDEFAGADLIVASDGVNSILRQRHADRFEPHVVTRPNRYIWLGTKKPFDVFTFDFRKTPHGWFQAHIYRFDSETSTFIVETTEQTYLAHGLDRMSQEEAIAFCEGLFADILDGSPLLTNARHQRGSAWLNFNHLTCAHWSIPLARGGHMVLMGDAAHTAHFAIGSGTKLAIDDAIELARQYDLHDHDSTRLDAILADYETIRRVDVLRIQNAARNAMEWFENVGSRYADRLPPEQFMYSLLTRSQRISHEDLRLRDATWLEAYERWFAQQAGDGARTMPISPEKADTAPATPPMFTPWHIRSICVPNRIVMSPMAVYSAQDGLPNAFHHTHFAARSLGAAGLVFAEMTAVSPDARITPGCLGLWNESQLAAWKDLVGAVRNAGHARFGIQIGHAGRKGATQLGWDGIDQPLEEGAWELISASALPYLGNSQVPRAMTEQDMARVTADFVHATELAARTGADWLELHCAHGYLLSSFLSPLTNQRDDAYGGSHVNRARFPLAVFRAMRAVWPSGLPMSVRLSCHDWAPGGNTEEDATVFAALFRDAGADMIDCSSGQVVPWQKPVYGRMYQTPFADKIRNEVGIPTIAVGAITEADHANSILAAGRADLCALGRPFLADPFWVLHEAAKIGYRRPGWPRQYDAGRHQYESLIRRAQAVLPKPERPTRNV